MHNDVIPTLPELTSDQLDFCDFHTVVSELKTSQNIFMIYETKQGEIKMRFDDLSAPLYACMVVTLSKPENYKVYEFIKLVAEAVYQEKKMSKNGHETACRIETFLNTNTKYSITNKKLI